MSQDVIGSADADTLAAEYVLGTLGFDERSSAQSLCAQDAEFAAKVTVWERWLGELHLMVEPVEPEPEIWQRIRAKLPQAEQPQPVVPLAETEPVEMRPQPEQDARLTLAEPNQVQSEPAEPKVAEPKAAEPKAAEPKAAEPKAAEPKAAELEPADHTRSDLEAVASARPPAAQKASPSSSEAQLNFEAAIAAAIAPPMPSDAPLALPDAPPAFSSGPAAAPPAAESDIGVSAPAPAPAFSATVPEPPSSPAAPEPPFTAPAAPGPETKPDEKLRPPTRQLAFWRAAALLLALAVMAVTGLVALWKFLPDRVPAALRPVELMRLLGIDIAAPPRRPPPPPESHFDE